MKTRNLQNFRAIHFSNQISRSLIRNTSLMKLKFKQWSSKRPIKQKEAGWVIVTLQEHLWPVRRPTVGLGVTHAAKVPALRAHWLRQRRPHNCYRRRKLSNFWINRSMRLSRIISIRDLWRLTRRGLVLSNRQLIREAGVIQRCRLPKRGQLLQLLKLWLRR